MDTDHAKQSSYQAISYRDYYICQYSPIIWYNKRQNTAESSSFGSEFIVLRISTKMLEGLRYKFRIFGVPIDGPADVFCDNQSVVTNVSIPSSVLNKKHNSIFYHRF